MKPTHERNQECLPPKKRDLPVSSEDACSGSSAGGADEAATPTHPSSEPQAGEQWMRVQPGLHYSVESSEGVTVPVDQYGMLYKVAVPSVSYSPTSLHPVLGHYTVPSPLLQHPGIPYHPLGYAQIPHSSLQFVGPPYAVPYAVPPTYVPNPLLPPQSGIPQSHLLPYPPVIQEGVVSPPPQPPTSANAFAKAAGTTLVLSPDQAAQQQQQHIGMAEVSSRPVPVYYHHPQPSPRATPVTYGEPHERKKEVNGGEAGRTVREQSQDSAYNPARPARVLHPENVQSRNHIATRLEERGSPRQSSTPDTDLEVQQVVGRLASPNQGASGGRKETPVAPLNLSQGSQRRRDSAQPVSRGGEPSGSSHPVPPPVAHHAVMLANGQQVLVPVDYQSHHYVAPPVDTSASSKPSEPSTGPSHFTKGAIIQLATGELKRVEDLQTQDFVRSAEASGGLKIDSSMVAEVRKSQQRPGLVSLNFTVGEQQSKVTIDVPPEHPFFVFGQGWSSCSPERTAQLYGLPCHQLQAGDVCVSIALQQQTHQQTPPRTPSKPKPQVSVFTQPMGPPAPQQPRHQARTTTHRDAEEAETAGDEPMQVGPSVQRAGASRGTEHGRSQSGYYLHTEGQARGGVAAAQRRWSAPGFQRYIVKGEEDPSRLAAASSGTSRPSFIPQEVKLSIEGRSNAGK